MGNVSPKVIKVLFLFCLLCSNLADAQMTRNQLLKKYYLVNTLEDSGNYSEAISVCEEIAAAYPRLPEPYLRMARLYDASSDSKMALVMYHQYANLEIDDKVLAEYMPRIRQLEEQFKISESIIESSPSEEEITKISVAKLITENETTAYVKTESSLSLADLDNLLLNSCDTSCAGLLTRKENTQHDIKELRNIPLRFFSIGNVLERYGIPRTVLSGEVTASEPTSKTDNFNGKWVSSFEDEYTGREYFILKLFQNGSNIDISLDNESGLFVRNDNLFQISWKTISNIWSPVARYFNAKELQDDVVSAKLHDGHLSFNFYFTKKKKTDYLKISKNVFSLISDFIPFGTWVNKISNGVFTYLQEKKSVTTYQTILGFELSLENDGVMQCIYTVREHQSVNGKERDVIIDRKTCCLFRCPDDYHYFEYRSNNKTDYSNKVLYGNLVKLAKNDADYNFPLAYMNYYGVGVDKNFSFAISRMQDLADNTGCNRARYWLASVCYNLSQDEENFPLRSTRQKYKKICDLQISRMIQSGFFYAYGLMGDIAINEDNSVSHALEFYEEGVRSGDAYCLYQLGMAYYTGHRTAKNPKKAVEYFVKAAQKGYPDAFERLAICYRDGFGVETDYAKYVNLLYEAIDQDSVHSIRELSNAYAWGRGVPQNMEKAMEIKRAYFEVRDEAWKGVVGQYCPKDVSLP